MTTEKLGPPSQKGKGVGQRRTSQQLSPNTKGPSKESWDRGEALYRFRVQYGISQVDLAERAGVSAGLIVRLELNRTDPQLAVLRRIAEVLGVSVVDLIGDDRPHIPIQLIRTLQWAAEQTLEHATDLRGLMEGHDDSADGTE